MKRKLCSVLLALCMVLTLLPVSAMADDGAPAGESAPAEAPAAETEYVAQIGAAKYKTLAEAVDAVPTDKAETEIVLLKDYIGSGIKVVADKNIVFNLNGKTYTVDKPTVGSSGTETNGFQLLKDSKVTFKNGTLNSATGADCLPNGGILIQNYCDLTLENVTLDTSANSNISYVISNNFGSLTAKGNTVIKAADGKVAFDLWYGMNSDGLYDDGVSVTFGTDFTGSVTGKIEYGAHSRVTSKDWMNKAKLTIANGNFDTTFVDSNPREGIKSTDFNISISGGTFSDLSALDYLAEVANVTVKLAADTTKDVTIPAGANVTLDLNGKTLTNVSGHTITNNGNLTVTGNGTVDNITNGKGALVNKVGAIATLNGGTFTRSQEAGTYEPDSANGNSWYTVKNYGTMTINAGATVTTRLTDDNGNAVGGHSSLIANGWQNANDLTNNPRNDNQNALLTVNGGTFIGGINTVKNDDYSELVFNNGTCTNYTQAAFQNHNIATINGGSFVAESHWSIYNCPCDANSDKGELTITGGSFTGNIAHVKADYGFIKISGGTYSVNPTAYVADTHIARKDGDAQYTVVAKSNLTAGVYTNDPSSALAPGYVSYKNSDNTYTVYYPVPVTPGNTSSSTTKNPDGSTTTTTTDKTTGTVTETTKNPDGSTTTVETKKDGSVTETNKTANGSVGTVKSDANGNSEISASISAADVNAAAKKNEPVAAPVSVAPAASPAAAPVIKLSVPASAGEVSVVIPVTNAQQGTVAIKVNPDGTEEIIKTSVVTKDGVVLGVKGSTQIKIVNNDKDFSDTVGHWAESDVDFVSARELFTGTAPQTFSPESATTRGMVVTVLARLAGESTDGGANWYDKGCAWAVTNGVSDGTDPNGTVTREQLAAMLYRYFGSPAVSGSLSFADASSVSEYAHDAMQWCVNNGIINGMDGLLNPQGQATRAQVSAMFARYIRLMSTK